MLRRNRIYIRRKSTFRPKLLDVAFIYNHGTKISKIAKFSPEKIKDVILENSVIHKEHYAISSLKNAMFDFSTDQFNKIFSQLLTFPVSGIA